MQENARWPVLKSDVARKIVENGQLPTPQEQADNLIRMLGNRMQGDPGRALGLQYLHHGAIVGSPSTASFNYVVKQLVQAKLLEEEKGDVHGGWMVRLSFEGWARYDELQRGVHAGRIAFMAMQYNDPDLDRVHKECFRKAVAETGFSLRRLDDEPQAGLIDNRLRVEIRGAAFLIADLSHKNAGAYWEAGFAEGLGKPVIYTCEKRAFDDKATRPHFDVNHHTTIIWSADDLANAAEQLKATIRNTLPTDAKMQDD
jgi:hypothetical protein